MTKTELCQKIMDSRPILLSVVWYLLQKGIDVKILVVILVALMVGGCTVPTLTKIISNESESLNFTDTDVFDQNLSNAMSINTDNIHVTIAGRVFINEIPDRLDNWLSAIVENEGRVDVEPKSNTKFSPVMRLSPVVSSTLEEDILYKPATSYNATILHKVEAGLISEIVFSKKPGPRKQ